MSLRYSKAFRNGLKINVGGWLTYTENKVIRSGETEKNADYAYRKWQEGFPYGQEFGYLLDRSNGSPFYNTPEELAQSGLTYEFGTPRVGDLKYVDLNKDGIINERDKAPIGTGAIPRVYYAFFAEAKYKSFDLSLLFQGVGKTDGYLNTYYVMPSNQGGTFRKEHIDFACAANPGGVTPRLTSANKNNWYDSSFWMKSAAYLRLKNIQLGYDLPKSWMRKIGLKSAYVYVNAQNLFTATNFWDGYDPEVGVDGIYWGGYPRLRKYAIGLDLKF